MSDETKEKLASGNFKRYQGNINNLYSDDRILLGMAGGRKAYYNPTAVQNREKLLADLRTNLNSPTTASKVSETLMAIDGVYADIVNFYVNMPLYRYTTVPVQTKTKEKLVDQKKYKDVYDRMIGVVDGISIEVIFPKILMFGMIYGVAYLYTSKDKNSETVETMLLPYLRSE